MASSRSAKNRPQETPFRIEPCHLENFDAQVANLIAELTQAAEGLTARLHPRSADSLADIVRVMNCYYSNLIEGHNTRPRDIERALADDFDANRDRRNLQMEARAHIRVQREIDQRHSAGTLPEPASVPFLKWLHQKFYEGVPKNMLMVGNATKRYRMDPGAFRSLPEHDVAVGRHQPPSSERVAEFMAYFADRFRLEPLGTAARVAAIGAAHHRFNYIHPFADGNGRVSRLMSHAMALKAGIGAHGLWSISRGLARGLESRTDYKVMMDAADSPRLRDTDGRGNLSLIKLREFIVWFLRVCLDQVRFMGSMFDLTHVRERLQRLVARHGLRGEATRLLEDVFLRGELSRGDAVRVLGLSERSAREILGRLVKQGTLASATPKGPVYLQFSVDSAEVLFPKLFPET